MKHITIITAVLAMTASLLTSSASALDPADLQRFNDTNMCEGGDHSPAIIGEAQRSYSVFGIANLSGANLAGANLSDAELIGADLSRAFMNSATLCNTTMPDESVIFSGC